MNYLLELIIASHSLTHLMNMIMWGVMPFYVYDTDTDRVED